MIKNIWRLPPCAPLLVGDQQNNNDNKKKHREKSPRRLDTCRVSKTTKDDFKISLGIKKMRIRKLKFRSVWEDHP